LPSASYIIITTAINWRILADVFNPLNVFIIRFYSDVITTAAALYWAIVIILMNIASTRKTIQIIYASRRMNFLLGQNRLQNFCYNGIDHTVILDKIVNTFKDIHINLCDGNRI
jgi:hypothetical protein